MCTTKSRQYYFARRRRISSRMASATSALLIKGSSPRAVRGNEGDYIGVHTKTGTRPLSGCWQPPCPDSFLVSFAEEFSTRSRVSMEKPHRNWWVLRGGPMVPRDILGALHRDGKVAFLLFDFVICHSGGAVVGHGGSHDEHHRWCQSGLVTASYICCAEVTGTSVVNLTDGSAVCPWIRVTSAPRIAAARA